MPPQRDAAVLDDRVEAAPPTAIDDDGAPTEAKVTTLVQGHNGNVTSVSVFEGLHEYVTVGHDR